MENKITTADLEPTKIVLTNEDWNETIIYLKRSKARPLQILIGDYIENLLSDMETEFAGANPDSISEGDTDSLSDYYQQQGTQPHRLVIPRQWQTTLEKAADRAGTLDFGSPAPHCGTGHTATDTGPICDNAIDDCARRLLGEEIAYSQAEPSPQYN